MVAKKSSCCGIKACRIHDFLRDLCLRKAEEDSFLWYFDDIGEIHSSSSSSSSWPFKQRRLGINRDIFGEIPFGLLPNVRSVLLAGKFRSDWIEFFFGKEEHFPPGVNVPRVLDLLGIKISVLPGEIEHLVHLKYLALRIDLDRVPTSISNLVNLETFIIDTKDTVTLPREMGNMVKLRHLYTKRGVFHFDSSGGCPPSSTLENLQTMYSVCSCKDCQNFLARMPNLRKLGFFVSLESWYAPLVFPYVEFLKHLETLTFSVTTWSIPNAFSASNFRELKFPTTVKKLTLKAVSLDWEEISILGTSLPNLEVLKLLINACHETIWDISEEEVEGFSKLKYLKLSHIYIEEWNASQDHFPSLETISIDSCFNLKGLPSDFSEIPGLQKIEIRGGYCKELRSFVLQLQEERILNTGDDSLQVSFA